VSAVINAALGNCKVADLAFGDRLQAFGGLVAIDKRTQLICACSANIEDFLGQRPEALLGRAWSVAFRAEQLDSLFTAADTAGQQLPRIQQAPFVGRPMLIASHSVGHITVVEVEPCVPEPRPFVFADRVGFLHGIAQSGDAQSAAELLMRTVADITEFDRVMLYRFLPDWHGEVLAERLKPGVPGYLGLRFPAGDIPPNARRLYLVNWQRVIADAHADSVALLALPGCAAIDLSFSQFRAVHPVHLQYLNNLGVEASFSVSIVVAGRLWGLIACHHLSPKILSLNQRQLCEEVARTAALHMSDMEHFRLEQARAGFREQLAAILGALRARSGEKRSIVAQLAPLAEMFHAQGILAHLDGQEFHSGSIPDEVSLGALRNSVQSYDRSGIAVRHSIDPVLAKYPALLRYASGSLYLPLLGEDFLLLLRTEQVETVRWAGKPSSEEDLAEPLRQLTPRASFQAWTETVKGCSDPWSEAEIEAAGKARELLIEYQEKQLLEALALRDPLTGLANRAMFEQALQEAIKLAIRDNMLSAVLMLDLDRFKAVNDTMGHAAGDELLIEVGNRLKQLMRARDTIARLGGDEFGIVAYELQRVEDAARTAERIIQEIRRPFTIRDRRVEIGVSIGVSMCPIHAIEPDELLEDADLALYQAKHAGRNTFKSFTSDMLSDSEQRESVRHGLIGAMQDGAMSLVYQPIVHAKTRALQGFEAFARWRHPVQGQLVARDFLPLVEQCQLLTQFAEWGIRSVLQQGKLWMRQALPLVPISVNLTARQFISLDLVDLCGALSQELDVGLEWLRLDLDETALQADFARVAAKIAALARLGILINIDHFGQGLVPLNRLGEVKINQLKLAGRHFEPGRSSTGNDVLVAMVHGLGRVLRIPIVASQIESEAMASRAIAADIEYLQGYRISGELTAAGAEQWLRNRNGSAPVGGSTR
jgi:diguanylate cyclase (GGDEF)-like protein